MQSCPRTTGEHISSFEGTTTSGRWFELEVRGGRLQETHGIRDVFPSTETVWEEGCIVKEGREWGSTDRPVLPLRWWQPALTDRVGRMCEPTVSCTEDSKNHPDGNYNLPGIKKTDRAVGVQKKNLNGSIELPSIPQSGENMSPGTHCPHQSYAVC